MLGATVGSYVLEREVGRGGMGAVYVGKHTLLGRTAAVKVLLPKFTQDPDVVQRFFNEARAATAIKHPGIVEVYDFGHADGVAYIVMELCEGESLASRIRRDPDLPVSTAVAMTRHIAGALAAAHAAGIVHRDLKPDNVFVVRDPDVIGGERIKLLDFGIAKLAADTAGPMKTSTGVIMGTPHYMSPEQCRGAGQVDHRSDLYSLGCILFELVCGRVPFTGEGAGDIIGAHLLTPPPKPTSFAPSLPADVEQLILALLAKKPGDRPADAEAVIAELHRVGGSLPPTLVTARGTAATSLLIDPGAHTAAGTAPAPRPSPELAATVAGPSEPPQRSATARTTAGEAVGQTAIGFAVDNDVARSQGAGGEHTGHVPSGRTDGTAGERGGDGSSEVARVGDASSKNARVGDASRGRGGDASSEGARLGDASRGRGGDASSDGARVGDASRGRGGDASSDGARIGDASRGRGARAPSVDATLERGTRAGASLHDARSDAEAARDSARRRGWIVAGAGVIAVGSVVTVMATRDRSKEALQPDARVEQSAAIDAPVEADIITPRVIVGVFEGEAMTETLRAKIRPRFAEQLARTAPELRVVLDPTSADSMAGKAHHALHVDAQLVKLDVDAGTLACKLKFTIATFPDRSIFAFADGGGKVTDVGTSVKDIEESAANCVFAIVEDSVAKQLASLIREKLGLPQAEPTQSASTGAGSAHAGSAHVGSAEAARPAAPADLTGRLLDEARAALRKQDWETARARFQAVADGKQRRGEALLGLGNVAFQTNQLDRALAHLDRALEAGAGARAHLMRGHVRFKLGRYDMAAEDYRAVLKADPRNNEARIALAAVEKRAQRSP